jgi:hypothetical protein
MTELSLPQRVGKTARGGWGLPFHWDAFDIERMDGEKIVSFDFARAADTWR